MKKLFILFIFINGYIFAQNNSSDEINIGTSIIFAINEIKKAQAPVIYNTEKKYILFTFEDKKEEIVHNVSVVFKHENFAIKHFMKKNINGVYFLFYKIDDQMLYNKEEIVYSFIVDGIWNEDPKNPYKLKKISGYTFSVFSQFEDVPKIPLNSPVIKKEKNKVYSVKFYYVSTPNKVIYLAGNFNNWDPYMYRMEESQKKPGVYSINLNFNKGKYFYYFIENGKPITDPNNNKTIYSKEASNASILLVK